MGSDGRDNGLRTEGAGMNGETSAPRRSARVAARGGERAGEVADGRPVPVGGSRIVTGFGDGRVVDVAAHERRSEAEGVQRAGRRREEGTRGRMTTFSGEDLNRSAGGPWQAGRR